MPKGRPSARSGRASPRCLSSALLLASYRCGGMFASPLLLVSGAAGEVKPGGQIALRSLCAAAVQQSPPSRLVELFAAPPDRLGKFSFADCGVYFDWAKTHLDSALL